MRRILVILIVCGGWLIAQANTNELGGWFSANATIGFTPKFSLTARGEYRARAMWQKNDLFFARLTANYRICPYFAIGAAYDNLNINNIKTDKFTIYHRAFANLSGTYTYNNFSVNLLERFVYAYIQNNGRSTYTLRSRLLFSYDIEQKHLRPYVATEVFNDLGHQFKVKYVRCYAGLHITCDTHNALQFYYCYQSNFMTSTNIHAIGIDYFFNWKLHKKSQE